MAVNVFERYGIKEVANVSLFALAKDEVNGIEAGDVVLYLDTLKVSTTETTAENVSAQGGWGNPKLVTWDYGKDINVTLEDAVVSWEELRIIQGGQFKHANAESIVKVRRTAEYTFEPGATIAFPTEADEKKAGKTINGKAQFPAEGNEPTTFQYLDMKDGLRGNVKNGTDSLNGMVIGSQVGETEDARKIRFFWEEERNGENGQASEIVISPNTFPGTYRVVGDALIRSEATGADEAFQFVINKAKMLSEVTLTMQAEGDPSTFSMTLNVLRDGDGNMMSLIKYN